LVGEAGVAVFSEPLGDVLGLTSCRCSPRHGQHLSAGLADVSFLRVLRGGETVVIPKGPGALWIGGAP